MQNNQIHYVLEFKIQRTCGEITLRDGANRAKLYLQHLEGSK